jgi:hypothetical protein
MAVPVTREQAFQVSFPLRLHDGTEHDVEGYAVAVWREWQGDEGLAALEQVALVGAVVDGVELSEDQLRRFEATFRPFYQETLEWIALSMAEARVSVLH